MSEIYKNGLVTLRSVQMSGIKEKMLKLEKAGVDLTPIWIVWLRKMKKYFRDHWKDKGTPYGHSWKGLNAAYRKIKGKGVDLIGSGRLKNAASGGPGWFQSIGKRQVMWGISGIPYARIHQEGGIIRVPEYKMTKKQRSFFWAMHFVNDNEGDNRWLYGAIAKRIKAHNIVMPARPFMATKEGNLPFELITDLRDLVFERLDNAR